MSAPTAHSILRGMKPQTYRDLIAKAVDQGWTLSVSGSGHVRLDPPTPPGGGPVFASMTSSNGNRAIQNIRSKLRKHGVVC